MEFEFLGHWALLPALRTAMDEQREATLMIAGGA